jgi:hypothetical protein
MYSEVSGCPRPVSSSVRMWTATAKRLLIVMANVSD